MAVTNNFTEPPPQTHPGDYSFASTVQYGSPQEITWSDNYTFPLNLLLWQETYPLDNNQLKPQIQTLATSIMSTQTSYSWDSRPTQNLSLTNLFWLGMYDASNGSGGPLFKSQYFNVTMSASSSSTIASSSSSITPSTSSSSTGTGQLIATPASTTPASTTPSASPTLKSTDHVALGAGLGAGLGGAALILAVALFFLFGWKGHKKNRKFGRPEVYQLAENDTFSR